MAGCRRRRLVAVALVALALGRAGTGGAEVRIDVREDGTALVDGQSESVRDVLVELCARAGVALQYDAPDAPVAVQMPGGAEPLEQVVERLLRGKSFVTRFAGEPPRLASLHVVGPGSGIVVSAPPDRNVVAPAALLEAAFGRAGRADRETAVRRLMDTVRDDPQRLHNFLSGDLATMQKALARYPEAPAVLRDIMDRPEVDGLSRARIQALLSGLP